MDPLWHNLFALMFIIPSYLFPKRAVIVAGVTNIALHGLLRSRVGRGGSRQREKLLFHTSVQAALYLTDYLLTVKKKNVKMRPHRGKEASLSIKVWG